MRLALTGASGFIGSAIARLAREAGHEIVALVRATSRRDHIEPFVSRFVTGEQDDRAAWTDLLEDTECVIHNSVDWQVLRVADPGPHLQANLLASLELLEASAPRPFIFMSTIAVHHDMRPRWAGVIDEDHPLRPATLYGAYKAAVEAHLWVEHFARGRHTCALRPCGVYGVDPKLDRSIMQPYIAKLRAGEPFDRAGGGKFVHVDDVAAAVIGAIDHPEAAGRAFNLVDCYARWSDLAVMLAEALGVDAEIDQSSPASPKNEFDCSAAKTLGVSLDRGHEGLREYLTELARVS